ncbi:GntR family transcriptional regulator [Enterococcus sp. 669A]|uniref:GntR family transcriptional regulator n=1 Tax=Candidatus Enterococcus moelleringii TaxID=2815325 RepID=A0ABS3L7N8_9ENTE|nr:GntR family transcriptional regulator [Enterococcus sp. 669A]
MKQTPDFDIAETVALNLDFTGRTPLKVAVYTALRTTILNGEIPAGTRINESVLSDKVRISRTTLRFALQKLHKERLLEHSPGKGMIVRGITRKDAYEIFAIRKSLDCLAAVTAMYKMTDEEFDELEQILIRMSRQPDRLAELFTEFNEFIYEKSQIIRLKDTMINIQNYLSYFRDLSAHSQQRRKDAIEDHRKIFCCMKQRSENQLKLQIEQHLDAALLCIVKEMDELNSVAL